MVREWRQVAIGELAEIFDGPHATPPKTSDGPIFLGISNLAHGRLDLGNSEHLSEEDYARWTRRVEPQAGDVVFSYETRLGAAALIPSGLRCCLGRRTGLLRARTGKVDKRFLLYAYLGPQFQETLRSRTIHGSTVDRIPLIDMPGFPIEVPDSIDEQRAIAQILGALDDKIELNRRMNQTLEAMARALFKSWFVDFDPVRAKAEGRRAAGVDAETAALFPDSFRESTVGSIPKGWSVVPIGDAVKVVGGSTPRTEEPSYWNGGIAFATPKDMAGLSAPALLHTERTITERGLSQIGSGMLPKGTVLLSSRAPIGYLAIAEIPVTVNQGFVAMICDGPLPHHYVLHWIRENLDTVIGNANGTTFLEISKRNFRPIPVLVPTSDVLRAFEAIVDPLRERLVSNLKESETLAALRDALLPKLLSGEIRLKDTERIVKERGVTGSRAPFQPQQ